MYKKFLSAILLGAFTIAATSTFVSCKDYDDDINSLQGQITANDKDNAALHDALTAAERELASLKSLLEQKEGELKALILTAQNAADAAQVAADAAQAAVATAQAQLQQAITDGDAATLAAAQAALTEAQTKLQQAIADGDAATLAAAGDALAEAVTNLNKAIEDGDNATLEAAKAAIEAAKTQVLTAIAVAKEEAVTAANAHSDEAVAAELARATAAEAALEVRIADTEKAIKDLKDLIKDLQDNKLDKATYEEALKGIYARLEAVEDGLGKHLTRIEALENGLKDEETARLALRADFEAQVKIIEGHTSKLEELEKTLATKAELAAEIAKVRDEYAADLKTVKEGLEKAIGQLDEDLKTLAETVKTQGQTVGSQGEAITGLGESIDALQDRAQKIEEEIEKINKQLSALNVLILRSLRSIVFIPDFYYWGIEATELNGVYVKYWNLPDMPAVNPDTDDPTWKGSETDAFCYDHKGHKKERQEDFMVERFVARYHLNPSTADLSKAEINILQADREYRTRAAAVDNYNTNIVVASFDPEKDIMGGDLHLNLDIKDPNKIKNIGHIEEGATGDQRHFVQDASESGLVTVFATEVKLNDAGDNTVTSDYAALRAKTYANGYRLAHTNSGDPAVIAPIAGATGSYTKVVNETNKVHGVPGHEAIVCRSCQKPLKNRHLFTDADETVYGAVQTQVKTLLKQPLVSALGEAASTTTAQDVVVWNSTINLNKLVEVHRVGDNGVCDDLPMTEEARKLNGFEYRFELTGIKMKQNATSESAHAAIKQDENGDYILRPQLPEMRYQEDGQNVGVHADWEATEQDRTTIGRTPLVRVLLVDTKHNDRVLDYGYIRLVIIDTGTPPPPPESIRIVEYNTAEAPEWTHSKCGDMFPKGWEWTQKWGSFENDLYNMFSLSQVEFEAKYDSVLVDLMPGKYGHVSGSNTLKQYIMEITAQGDTTFRAATADEYLGAISVKIGEDIGAGTKTQVVTWKVYDSEIADYAKDGKKETTRVIKYQVVDRDDLNRYKDIYVILKAGDITKKEVEIADPVVKGKFDSNKIREYWYDENTQKTSNTLFEAHLNVPSPEDWIVTWREENKDKKPFEFLLSSDFNQNIILDETKLSNYITVEDPSGFYPLSKAQISFGFVVDQAHSKFKGYSGTTYTMSVDAYNGTPMWALYASAGGKKELAAYLEYDNSGVKNINHIKIVLNKAAHRTNHTNSFIEDLLNYKAHNDLSDDFLKVLLGYTVVWTECPYEAAVPAFQVRFLRPVNMFNENYQVQDAANTTQIFPLYDLISFTDWREQWNPTAESTINKPRRENDYVQDANGKWIVDYWYYYNIKHILIGDAKSVLDPEADEVLINDRMHTNLDGNDIKTTILADITKNVEFSYIAPKGGRIGEPDFYGSILYTNNRSTVDNFIVTVPVTVCYEWGHLYMDVTIDIRKTLENTDVKRYR